MAEKEEQETAKTENASEIQKKRDQREARQRALAKKSIAIVNWNAQSVSFKEQKKRRMRSMLQIVKNSPDDRSNGGDKGRDMDGRRQQ